jgi:hypothetical protein
MLGRGSGGITLEDLRQSAHLGSKNGGVFGLGEADYLTSYDLDLDLDLP